MSKMRSSLMIGAVLVSGILLWGCEKKSETTKESVTDSAAPAAEATEKPAAATEKPAVAMEKTTTGAAAAAGAAVAAVVEQKVCPVSDHDIDPKAFLEFKGKKVYFCCKDCIEEFNKTPEKFLTKLPQFGGKEAKSKGKM